MKYIQISDGVFKGKLIFCEVVKTLTEGSAHFEISMNFYATFFAVCAVLFFGAFINRKVSFLDKYSIPVPVSGGLLVALLLFFLEIFLNVKISFQETMRSPLMLMFFTSVGFSADVKSLKSGGKILFFFGIAMVLLLLVQNTIGVIVMSAMGENPLLALLAGSITLSGGHGTGAAWGATFSGAPYGFKAATEVAMASATYGLIAGGLLGGPVSRFLIKKYQLTPNEKEVAHDTSDEVFAEPEVDRRITSVAFLQSLGLFAVALFSGTVIDELTKGTVIALPTFVWCLLSAIFIRNTFFYGKKTHIFDRETGIIGNVSLSLFLAIAIITLNLAELTKLALPLIVLLIIQSVAIVFFVRYVTFNLCGKNYDAACIVAGHTGFGMGATPTAVANLQAVTNHFGPSRIAFIVVPIMGGFIVDIANAIVIKLFLLLPMFRTLIK